MDKAGSGATPVAEEEFSLISAISQELTKVPVQKEPLHPEDVSPDMEGMESLNSLPDISLSGALSGSKWEEEDGVVRSGEFNSKFCSTDSEKCRLFVTDITISY